MKSVTAHIFIYWNAVKNNYKFSSIKKKIYERFGLFCKINF